MHLHSTDVRATGLWHVTFLGLEWWWIPSNGEVHSQSPGVVGRAWWKPHFAECNSFRAPFLWAHQDPTGRCIGPVSAKEAGSWQLITAGLGALPSWCSTPAMHPLHFQMLVFAPHCLYSRCLAILAFLLNSFSSSLTLSLSPSTNVFFLPNQTHFHVFSYLTGCRVICLMGMTLSP